MRKSVFLALALMAIVGLGSIVYESASFAQNTNSSTTNSNMSGRMSRKHMSRRWRRHRKAPRHRRRAGRRQ